MLHFFKTSYTLERDVHNEPELHCTYTSPSSYSNLRLGLISCSRENADSLLLVGPPHMTDGCPVHVGSISFRSLA